MSENYAGDITPQEAWNILETEENCVLIDVRTEAEWAWVGQVDLSSLGKQQLNVEWVRFPGGIPNDNFVQDVEKLVSDKSTKILMLCRSGVRSKHTSIALTACGFETCYNVAGGFEGDKDVHQHRGTVNGWKVAGLPWIGG